MTKRYIGRRDGQPGPATVLVVDGDKTSELDPAYRLRNHSPDGFQWGYGGSGPAQLALALLVDALHDDYRAVRMYQRFKLNTIANIPTDNWELTEDYIRRQVEELEASEA